MEGLGFALKEEAILQTLVLDVLESRSIEGEILDRQQVRFPRPLARHEPRGSDLHGTWAGSLR